MATGVKIDLDMAMALYLAESDPMNRIHPRRIIEHVTGLEVVAMQTAPNGLVRICFNTLNFSLAKVFQVRLFKSAREYELFAIQEGKMTVDGDGEVDYREMIYRPKMESRVSESQLRAAVNIVFNEMVDHQRERNDVPDSIAHQLALFEVARNTKEVSVNSVFIDEDELANSYMFERSAGKCNEQPERQVVNRPTLGEVLRNEPDPSRS